MQGNGPFLFCLIEWVSAAGLPLVSQIPRIVLTSRQWLPVLAKLMPKPPEGIDQEA